MTAEFAAIAVALYVGHHVGDYWVQTDHQAKHKGLPGRAGRKACLAHVLSYVLTQIACFGIMHAALGDPAWGFRPIGWEFHLALLISGLTHYAADRREHGLMFWLARRIPGKAAFLKLGVPREMRTGVFTDDDEWDAPVDNPQLATGAWALDQSWHLFFGVFVPALVMVAL
jgi:hypothetical protein